MNYSALLRFVFAFVFVCLTSATVAAQDSGISGYTSITYDEETNTIMAYAETTINYDIMTDYRGEVWLTVTKNSGAYAANVGTFDNGNGVAAVEVSFAGEPGETYRAVSNHRARLQMWDYVDRFPYGREYFDNWYFTGFEQQNIYQPWYHYFGSPGNYFYRRRDDIVSVGRTYDTDSVTVQASDIDFDTVSNDVNDKIGNFSSNTGNSMQTATVNLSGASQTVCGANRTSFNITLNFVLPYNATTIAPVPGDSKISDTSNQQFQYLSANFDGTGFATRSGVMNITVRQVRPTASNNSFKVHIEGALRSGGRYYGDARVKFTCP